MQDINAWAVPVEADLLFASINFIVGLLGCPLSPLAD